MSTMSRLSPHSLRIACLLPSATDICIALGLADNIVGVTHECNVGALVAASDGGKRKEESIFILTKNGLNVTEQGDIHKAVLEQQALNSSALSNDAPSMPASTLYPIDASAWRKAAPTVVLTQDLCAVCAPSSDHVKEVIMSEGCTQPENVKIVVLKPSTLHDVANSFVTVAAACGVPERGTQLRDDFLDELKRLNTSIEESRDKGQPKPSLLLLEWLDPPFDGGHWIMQQIEMACVRPAIPKVVEKSHPISWTDIREADPDVVIVACCGFDLERNVIDTQKSLSDLSLLSAYTDNCIFAADGNAYFACPGPNLIGGAAILARCAYQDQPRVLQAIDEVAASSSSVSRSVTGWQRVSFSEEAVHDVEDLVIPDFSLVHEKACMAGDLMYVDPVTGYSVFTELAHKKRGTCCGSGCRHCPFNHVNVSDKTRCIQQPAFLHEGESELFSVTKHDKIKALFFSGGKDSFLTLRALVRQYINHQFGLVLLTTFDAQTRMIAHQDVHIDDILRQAKHLDIALIGIPMHRASREPYVDRIRRALDVIQSQCNQKPCSLVFGDLHLDHIKSWRDEELGKLGIDLEYPLWNVSYTDLMEDIERSGVTFELSAVTKDGLSVGTIYNRQFYDKLQKNIDGFGENGEFHTIARVWDTERDVALGLKQE